MKPTLRQLEIFAAVARLGSVSRAAEALALSQSAASSALSDLERGHGHPLFDRVGKSLRLNALGAQVLPRALELLERAGEIEGLLSGREGLAPLEIGATLTVGNYLAIVILAEFLRRRPQARVRLKVQNTARVVELLLACQLDLGLVEGEVHHPDLTVAPWLDDELTVFCPPGHRLAKRGRAGLDELLAEPWILREPGSGTRETLDRALGARRAELDVRLELEHTEAIKRAVESGFGLGCISRLALREAFRRGSLVPVATPELTLMRRFQFVWHGGRYQAAAVREFLALAREMTAGVKRSDEVELPYIP